ncbi:MEDS domain-containing protein [Pseudalkalibacillus sp. SCS-8]|uniref:MEDS domain-containing protein n=1 Tax=Pseudalkalibacillus nanhaiensis TaxID=3115291 RepID=UPI0032DB07A5
MKIVLNDLFRDQKSVHILYKYYGLENYVNMVVKYTQDGIRDGDYVILIENDPVYKKIEKELNKRLSEKEMEYVHWVNSFDFYFSSGSYHPPAIIEYFSKMIQPYLEKKLSFRAWAHVEWATMSEPLHIIEDLEKPVDEAVKQISFPLICAYQGERMPDYLRRILMETHPYILLEDDVVVSDQYKGTMEKEPSRK